MYSITFFRPHISCDRVMIYNFEKQKISTLIDEVDSYPEKDDSFAGFYGMNLPSNPFLRIDRVTYLVFSTPIKNRIFLIIKPGLEGHKMLYLFLTLRLTGLDIANAGAWSYFRLFFDRICQIRTFF